MTLELNHEEQIVLTEVLGSYLEDLHHEIHKTEDRSFKETLKHKKELLQNFLKRIHG